MILRVRLALEAKIKPGRLGIVRRDKNRFANWRARVLS